jgi:hypothetical protein
MWRIAGASLKYLVRMTFKVGAYGSQGVNKMGFNRVGRYF